MGDELQRLYEVANDYELTVLEDLAVRAGLRWICPVRDWTNVVGERCGDCGRTQDEAQAKASDEISDDLLDPEGAGYIREPPWDGPDPERGHDPRVCDCNECRPGPLPGESPDPNWMNP